MISTVTTSTISGAINSVLAESAASISMLVLLVLLAIKELASTTADLRYRILAKVLNIGILPLLVVFVVLVCSRLAEALR